MDAIVVVHFLSNAEEELAPLEHVDHHCNVLLDLLESLLGLLRLITILLNLRLEHLDLVLQGLDQVLLASFGEISTLLDLLNLVVDVLGALLELIELSVEHVNVVLKTIVLLLSLDEGRHDLLNIGDTGGLLDLVESILDDLHISEILVHELPLLLVGLNDLIETPLTDDYGVGESCALLLAILTTILVEVLIVELDHLILLLELQLELLNNVFKLFLLLLVFGLKGDDLIIGLLSDLRNRLIILVLNFSLLLRLFDALLIPGTLILARSQLLSEHVNLPPQLLVLGLGHIKSQPLVVDLFLR